MKILLDGLVTRVIPPTPVTERREQTNGFRTNMRGGGAYTEL